MGRWASGRRIPARRRSGGGREAWIRWGKVWERGRIRAWGRVLTGEASWVREPVESTRSITSRTLESRASPPRTRSRVGLAAGGRMARILS